MEEIKLNVELSPEYQKRLDQLRSDMRAYGRKQVWEECICANCKWFQPTDTYFFCDNEHVPFVENGLSFTDEIEYWGCNQWEEDD